MEVVKIEWSEERKANEQVSYNHVIGTSPLGEWIITWKGWKEWPSYDVEESPFGYIGEYGCTLDEAKELAQKAFEDKIRSCLR